MPKAKRFPWIILLGFSGIVIFLFRYELINNLQKQILTTIRNKAVVSNQTLSKESAYSGHLIYSLKGLDRLWPHRVNTLRRLKYLYNDFAGFECDIRIDASAGQLFIAHDPEELSSLVFTDYLLQERKLRKLFWLDVKNLGSLNQDAFSRILEKLESKYFIKNRIIIESSNLEALETVGKQGWLTSYYMPSEKASLDILQDYTGIISQDISLHDYMRKNYPGRKQLIWDIRFWDCMSRDVLLKNANDTTALVVLINVKSPGYR